MGLAMRRIAGAVLCMVIAVLICYSPFVQVYAFGESDLAIDWSKIDFESVGKRLLDKVKGLPSVSQEHIFNEENLNKAFLMLDGDVGESDQEMEPVFQQMVHAIFFAVTISAGFDFTIKSRNVLYPATTPWPRITDKKLFYDLFVVYAKDDREYWRKNKGRIKSDRSWVEKKVIGADGRPKNFTSDFMWVLITEINAAVDVGRKGSGDSVGSSYESVSIFSSAWEKYSHLEVSLQVDKLLKDQDKLLPVFFEAARSLSD